MYDNKIAVHVVDSRTGKRRFVGTTSFDDDDAMVMAKKLYPLVTESWTRTKRARRAAETRAALRNFRRNELLEVLYAMHHDAWEESRKK